jgi:hypothetical protein
MRRTATSAVPAQPEVNVESPPVDTAPPANIPVSFDEVYWRLQNALLMQGKTCHAVERPGGGFTMLESDIRAGACWHPMDDFVARARELKVLEDCESPQIWWKL